MHSPNTADTKGNSKSSSSQLRSHGRGHNDDHNDRADGHHEHFHALKQLFRIIEVVETTSPLVQAKAVVVDIKQRLDQNHLILQSQGPFRGPEATSPRPTVNPGLLLKAVARETPLRPSPLTFYNCENLYIGRSFLTSPDLKRLESAAVAFLGECQLHDMPETSIPRRPNPAYRGLSLQGSHGYHLHFPDCAGMKPFHSILADDWAAVMRRHRRSSPDGILLVGVGIGEPGSHCL
ncbi:hypothetical protein F5Y10DRAFT_268887 [Nemania abortiva]|nr:hypothetical protein F5Y10DRAFT_268887 [Nemania abortiva]